MTLIYREVYRYIFGCGGTALLVLLAIGSARNIVEPPKDWLGTMLEWFITQNPFRISILCIVGAVICILVAILYPSKEIKQTSAIDKKTHKLSDRRV